MKAAESNPFTLGYPVSPRLFAGRRSAIETLRHALRASREGNLTNVFIEGEWGIGKTSLLRKIWVEVDESAYSVSEDVESGEDQGRHFFSNVFNELLNHSRLEPDDLEVSRTWDRRSIRRSLQTIWQDLSSGESGAQVLVIGLDNLERARPEFLEEIRDIFQRLGGEGARYVLIFAGKAMPVGSISAANPVRRFFQNLFIGPLEPDESVEAIQKPLEIGAREIQFTGEACRLIHDRAAGHPFFLKAISSSVFDLARGRGEIDPGWLTKHWVEVEERLERSKFGDDFNDLPDGEKTTLLRASFLAQTFEARDLRVDVKTSLDTYLRRLRERGLLRKPRRYGSYELYHPLFREFLQAKARERKMKPRGHREVRERRAAGGRVEIEELMQQIAEKRLDILDQHFRGRAVAMVENALSESQVKIRVLMGCDPQWPKTLERLRDLHGDLRKDRLEIRSWPESERNPVPWHVRLLIGDREVWECSHSLDGCGRKATTLTDKTAVRRELEGDFGRWWAESRRVFPLI